MNHSFTSFKRASVPLVVLLLFLSSSFLAVAQHGTIEGHIATTDQQAAIGVGVGLKGTTIGATTDAEGNYTISNVKPGTYLLLVQLVGLEPQEQRITVEGYKTTYANFTLQESATKLQEVVVQASRKTYKADLPSESLRSRTPLLQMPQNIQVVTGDLMQDQQVFDMLEGVSRNVSGVTRLEHWDNYARLNMRGARIAPFRNGMNIQSNWGPLAEDMSMVERIEFVKGPAGFMMANGEPSGFYNVVTKKPSGITKGAATITLGSYDTYRATTDFDGKLSRDGKLLYRLNLMGQQKGSHRPDEFNNRYTIAPVLKYLVDDRTSLTFEYTYQHAQMSVLGANYVFSPNGYGDLPIDFTTTEASIDPTVINDHSSFVILEHKLNDSWKVTGQLGYFNNRQVGSSLWPVATYDENWNVIKPALDAEGNMQRGISIWDASNVGKFGQFYINGEVTTGLFTHRVLAGLDLGSKEYIADWNQSFKLGEPFNIYDPAGAPAASAPEFDRSRSLRVRAGSNLLTQNYSGLYVQDEIAFFDNKVRLTLAGRYTNVRESSYGTVATADKVTPRIGISGSLNKETSVYALYDQAFIPQSAITTENKNIGPITGNNIEAGIKKDWFGGRWNSSLSVYQITKNNAAQALPPAANGMTYYAPLGQTQTQGVEIDVKGKLAKGLNLIMNYAYTNSEITKDSNPANVGNAVPGATKHITNAWLAYRLQQTALKGLGATLGYQWQVDRSSWFIFDGSESALPDYFRLDGAVSWQKDRFSLGLNVNNLLNEYLFSGAPYGGYYYWQTEAPRNYRVSIGYKF